MLMTNSFQYLSFYKQEPRWFECDYDVQEESELLKAPTISALANEILECFEVDPSHRAKVEGKKIPVKKNLKLDHLSASTDCEYRSLQQGCRNATIPKNSQCGARASHRAPERHLKRCYWDWLCIKSLLSGWKVCFPFSKCA